MKINDRSIRGIFIYSDDAVFEKGDFVLDGSYLYVCQADTSVGEKPSEATNKFSLYVGGEFATEEEFDAYASGSTEHADKFVSAYLLGRILNSYMAGYDEYGLITNRVGADGEIFMADYFGSEYGSTISGVKYLDPLREIMVQPSLNNAIFSVSRSIVVKILGTGSSATDNVLLKQYTYEDKGTSYVRVQELVDPETGMTHYRYLKFSNNDFSGDISSWVLTCTDEGTKSKVDFIKAYYEDKLVALQNEHAADMNAFRFKELPIIPSGQTGAGGINISERLASEYITLCLGKIENSDGEVYYKTTSITLPMNFNNNESRNYIVFGGEVVTISVTSGILKVTSRTATSGITILNAYYRQTYQEYNGL